jgi:hypothetical protein
MTITIILYFLHYTIFYLPFYNYSQKLLWKQINLNLPSKT